VKILFVARHFTYFRNFDSVLRELARRGHHIHLAVEHSDATGGLGAVEALAREHPSITYGEAPDRTSDRRSDLARRIRFGLDYLRYLDRFYDEAPLRRVRARERTPLALIRFTDPRIIGGTVWRRLAGRCLHALDLAIEPSASVFEYVRSQAPDVLLVTPLVDLGSQQIDYVRAARRLRIPSGLAVWSWDHLSSKAYIRECPERVFVWNETQRREAVDEHHVPRSRVVVTGAQCFDHWFERQPGRSREAFCRALGLPADRPLILYVCSALIMGSPSEAEFVREWLTHLRASGDARVANAAVLVRPHPAQTYRFDGIDLSDLGPVAVWGSNPIEERSRSDYFDSLFHSAAVVGLNTSAFIEAGIVGRQVLTILPPRFHDNQEGTVHFKYLLEIGGGLLRVSRDLDTHVAQLSSALVEAPSGEHPHKAFLESFVRPHGLTTPATPLFADAVESLRGCALDPRDVHALTQPAWRRALARRLENYLDDPRAEGWVLSPRELEKAQRVRSDAERKAEIDRQRVAQRLARKAAYGEQRARERRAARQVDETAKRANG
jgi:hypothetical protein